MNRNILGPILLAVLLLGSVLCTRAVDRAETPVADALQKAAQYAMEGNDTAAQAQAQYAHRLWQKRDRFLAAVTDHAPLEAADAGFAQLTALDSQSLAAACLSLAESIRAISDYHSLNWWNLL